MLNLLLLSINKLRDLNHLMIVSAPAACGKRHSSSRAGNQSGRHFPGVSLLPDKSCLPSLFQTQRGLVGMAELIIEVEPFYFPSPRFVF